MTEATNMGSAQQPSQQEGRSPADLDRVSLTQALRDFEIANARVLDLTQRLIESERRRRDIEHEFEQFRMQLSRAAEPTRSRAQEETLSYRVARWAYHRAKNVAKRVLQRHEQR